MFAEAEGASGGLVTKWNRDCFSVINSIVKKNYIFLHGSLNNVECIMVNIYAPNDAHSRREVWNDVCTLKSQSQLPWCIGGDVNEINVTGKRSSCTRLDRGMRDFIQFIDNLEVVNSLMIGRRFTWSNFQDSAVHSRLDRFLMSMDFLHHFKMIQWGLHRPISDHCSIMISDDNRDWGPKPFRFMDMWLTNPKCMKLAEETWNVGNVQRWAGFRVVRKLQERQKSRGKWLKLGDKNTRFFHSVANHRFLKNIIGAIRDDEGWVEEPKLIKEAAMKYFNSIFKKGDDIRPTLGGVFNKRLHGDLSIEMETHFEEVEILLALKSCSSFKAPGPDGFNFSFFKKAWPFMKKDVDGPIKFQEFRPISTVGGLYKLLSKVLANKLEKTRPALSGEAQTALVNGRQILDGASDTVNWEFLLDMLHNVGFGVKWCSWGDPLSPFLFTIVAEALNVLLERAKEMGLINGVSIGNGGFVLTYLQYVDDTINFCKNNIEEIRLKINFSKSVVCGIGIPETTLTQMANRMGCRVDKLPLKYLGLPLGANLRRISTWQPIVDRIKKKLSKWKGRRTTKGGKLTQIKSSVSILPIYYMSLFKMPITVAKSIEKIQRQFFWGDTLEKKKLHLVKWSCLTKSRKRGGLGIKKLLDHYLSLLAKWWWRFYKEKGSLWHKVISMKYGLDNSEWLLQLPMPTRASNVWKDICSVGDISSEFGKYLHDGFKIEVKSGNLTKFWKHKWLGETPLRSQLPRLYAASLQQETKIADIGERSTLGWWPLNFRRNLHDWENMKGRKNAPFVQRLVKPQDTCFSIADSYGKCGRVKEVIFNNKHLDIDEVVDLIKIRVAFWIKAKHNVTKYSVE
ncbi:uncharacterized protein LOC131302843 [Rhododendron vialii]|uniref:uncharacterized protein LOC131302843 n=1 Tax=Rhododendron vialii TaxID=182163 RepID=UPI00265E0916|nr:uncharacterized protein LOC131302843 [Rhododendron vialii]